MLWKVNRLRGLNLRDHDINRPAEFASDIRNVEKNSKNELIQRGGYDYLLNPRLGGVQLWGDPLPALQAVPLTIIDVWEYVGGGNRKTLVLCKHDSDQTLSGLYELVGSTLTQVPIMTRNVLSSDGGQPIVNDENYPEWISGTSPVEVNQNLYWVDVDGTNYMWKYDGYRTHRAGIPRLEKNVNVEISAGGPEGSGAWYFRIFLGKLGLNGITTYGDYVQFDQVAVSTNFNFDELSDSSYDGFLQRWGTVNGNQALKDGVDLTLDVTAGSNHNFEAGDWVLATKVDGSLGMIQVDSVTATTITFTSASFGTDEYRFLDQNPVDRSWVIRVYKSQNADFGYFFEQQQPLGRSDTIFASTASGGITIGEALEETYDTNARRRLPPRMKYISTFGESIIGGFSFDKATFDNRDSSPSDLMYWSAIPTITNGSSVETFFEAQRIPIGISEDGVITGLHGNDDNIVVHKDEQSYYVNGDLATGSLRTRKMMTANIGGASHRSIEDVDGGHLYVSPRGVFWAGGGRTPKELSDIIEPLFRDNLLGLPELDLFNANSINDFYREKIYIFIPYEDQVTYPSEGIVLVYDFYFKEWFLHENIKATGGFVAIGRDIYHSDGSSIYKRNLDSTLDDTTGAVSGRKAIESYYTTGWFDIEQPSLRKKFVNLILHSLGTVNWTAEIIPQKSWKNEDLSSFEIEFDDDIRSDDHKFPIIESPSMRFTIKNKAKKEGFHVTAYEVEYEMTQTKPKGAK